MGRKALPDPRIQKSLDEILMPWNVNKIRTAKNKAPQAFYELSCKKAINRGYWTGALPQRRFPRSRLVISEQHALLLPVCTEVDVWMSSTSRASQARRWLVVGVAIAVIDRSVYRQACLHRQTVTGLAISMLSQCHASKKHAFGPGIAIL
ncbi:hypothetical protein B0H13DRAFT_1850193 [Mycena leptocephala]|nr:hypothetical protein B0H13DRAFT_1850193 [Mycena leptocephala]